MHAQRICPVLAVLTYAALNDAAFHLNLGQINFGFVKNAYILRFYLFKKENAKKFPLHVLRKHFFLVQSGKLPGTVESIFVDSIFMYVILPSSNSEANYNIYIMKIYTCNFEKNTINFAAKSTIVSNLNYYL